MGLSLIYPCGVPSRKRRLHFLSIFSRVTGRVGILLKNLVVGTVLGAELGYGIGFAPNGPSKKLLPLPASAANPAQSSTLRGC